jgi:uncharacterized damage-inducible protein DinB
MDTPQSIEPPASAPEPEMLSAWLDYHRTTLLRKIDGVSDADLRRPMVPSGTSLLGLVKHLAWVEIWWFQITFAGHVVEEPWTEDDPDADFRIEPSETTREIVDFYLAQCATNRSIVAEADSLDAPALKAIRAGSFTATLRWILNHMIEETARHNGHADILREMIDGVTGE